MRWWAVKLMIGGWFCQVRDHSWLHRGNTRRLCPRCGRREKRIDRLGKWRLAG